jgi:hypothetical protein
MQKHFPFSSFVLALIPLLTLFWTMSTYPHEASWDEICSYVNDMTCWNNLDINEFRPKASLFPQDYKHAKIKRKQISLWNKKNIQISWNKRHNSFLYEIEAWTRLQWCWKKHF